MTLDELKDVRYAEIDMNTQYLISQGFTFGGHTFSMSLTAQLNWSNFPNLPDALFPLTVIDIVEQPYVCSLANKMNFYYSALNAKNQYLQSGGVLKAQIHACVDEACVTAIIDNR
jgi:hypothetical protein